MNTTTDFSIRRQTLTCEQLLDANTDFVKGVIYKAAIPEAKYVSPVRTFNGFCCDCYLVRRTRKGFEMDTIIALPVNKSDLGEPVCCIADGPDLLAAAMNVIAAWESGDLAAAVRALNDAADEISR